MNEKRRDWLWKMLLEVVLISIAVFLGMAADQWRTDRQHRADARAALQRFRNEIAINQAAVLRVRDYHARMRQLIIRYLDPKTRAASNLQIEGIQPVQFEQTAWQLAIATQSLADIDPAVAYELERIYNLQGMYIGLTNGVKQALYLRPPEADFAAFLQSLKVYYDDIVIHEPALLDLYGKALPVIDSALRD
jgi:hypothetical protein